MKKSFLLVFGVISCLLFTSIATAKPLEADEVYADLTNYSSEVLSSDEVAVLNEKPALAKSGTTAVGATKTCEADFSNYENYEASMREISDGVYEILDNDGTVIAIYEENVASNMHSRLAYTIDWTVKPGVQTGSNTHVESYDGLNFSYDISFSRTGSSKIGFANHDKQTVTWVEESTDGFYGGFTFKQSVGIVGLAIKNESENTITYTGLMYIIG